MGKLVPGHIGSIQSVLNGLRPSILDGETYR